MPDILSIGLGGGTRVNLDEQGRLLAIGPDSVGYRLSQEAYIFGGSTLTASDIAVKAGLARFGNPENIPSLGSGVTEQILARFRSIFEDGIDRMKTAAADVPVVLVGGGSILVPSELKGALRVIKPEHASVANAVGAAIAQVGAEVDRIVAYDNQDRDEALKDIEREAAERAIAAGADASTVRLVDVEETYLSYIPGNTVQLRAKVVGDLAVTAA
jgi:N-methylhydantoinase A/oxoprolinase/acetone carboxylase beta subunit